MCAALAITGSVMIVANIYVENLDIPRVTATQAEVTGTVSDIETRYGQTYLYLKNIEFYGDSLRDYKEIRAMNPLCNKMGCICVLKDSGQDRIFIGSRVILKGKISIYDKATNPGEFDSRKYYISKGYLFKATSCELLKSNGKKSIGNIAYSIRLKTSKLIDDALDSKDAGILKALLIADKTDLDKEVKELYRDAGASHLLAISGLHITLFASLILFILKKTPMNLNTAYILTVIILFLYGRVIGFSPSSLRAIVMFTILCIGKMRKKSYDSLTAMAVASLITILLKPLCVLQTGFLMSYLAIVGIALILPIFTSVGKRLPGVISSLAMSASVTLSTLPVVMNSYYQFNLFSPLLNIILVPGMTGVLVIGILCLMTQAIKEIPALTDLPNIFAFIIHIFFLIYEWLMKLELMIPHVIVTTGARALIRVIAYEIILILISRLIMITRVGYWRKNQIINNRVRKSSVKLQKDRYEGKSINELKLYNPSADIKRLKRKKNTALASLFIVLVLNTSALLINVRSNKTEFLDVGQGLCACVQYNGQVFMYDGGSTDIKQVGKYVIEPYLKYYGITHIDAWFISHGDADHISGIKEIISDKSVKTDIFIVSEALYNEKDKLLPDTKNSYDVSSNNMSSADSGIDRVFNSSEDKHVKFYRAIKGDIFSSQNNYSSSNQGITFTILSPSHSDNIMLQDCNETSLVVLMQTKEANILFTGDSGLEAERNVLDYLNQNNISVDILQVAHHGSAIKTNSADFLNSLRPQCSVISCGLNNSYGHPHTETLANLVVAGSKYYRTDYNGCISIIYADKRIKILPFSK